VRLVVHDGPLLQLREPGDTARACELPPGGVRQPGALCRTLEGHRLVPLAPLQARLMRLLERHPLGVALAQLEREQASQDVPQLAQQTQSWLADGIRLGFWTGLS